MKGFDLYSDKSENIGGQLTYTRLTDYSWNLNCTHFELSNRKRVLNEKEDT